MCNENTNLRTMWVEALRSGKYLQGAGFLKEAGKFCCLGVLCDLVDSSRWTETGEFLSLESYPNKHILPEDVKNKVGLQFAQGLFTYDSLPIELKEKIYNEGHGEVWPESEYLLKSLDLLNDAGVSFDTIADVIEAEPEGLFE